MDINLDDPENTGADTGTTDTTGTTDDTTPPMTEEECPDVGCVFVFISPIPGSTVIINGTKAEDGLKRDTHMLTFAPVGEKKPHPILIDAMYTDFGMIVTDDPKVAWVMNQAIARGGAQYFHYDPNNPAHTKFSPEIYAIETPDQLGMGITLQ